MEIITRLRDLDVTWTRKTPLWSISVADRGSNDKLCIPDLSRKSQTFKAACGNGCIERSKALYKAVLRCRG
jgi:hypothetical protein